LGETPKSPGLKTESSKMTKITRPIVLKREKRGKVEGSWAKKEWGNLREGDVDREKNQRKEPSQNTPNSGEQGKGGSRFDMQRSAAESEGLSDRVGAPRREEISCP